MSLRILLADDHQIVCDGLRMVIEGHGDMEVVGVAKDGREAVSLARQLSPDVVIMDVAMPELNGIDATRRILELLPHVKVVALSMHSDRRYVTGMLAAGVAGYLLKDCAAQELAQAIHTVVAGKVYLSPGIAGVVVEDYTRQLASADEQPVSVLTVREREVLQLLAEGNSTKQIARTLHLSVKTIETHRRQTMEKLDLRSVAELTKYAIREGLTSLDD